MIKIIRVVLFIASISSYGQVLVPDFYLEMSKIDYETLKGQPLEIFYETINREPYKHITKKKYYAFDANKNLKMKGLWKLDSITNKTVLSNLKAEKKNKFREEIIFNSIGKPVSKTRYIKYGHFIDSIAEKKTYTYDNFNSTKKITTHISSIDTLDFGYEQINAGVELDSKYITYNIEMVSQDFYNHKEQLIKTLAFSWTQECYTYLYDETENIIEKNTYKIHSSCSGYHSDCNSSIPNCKELKLHKFNDFEITNNVWGDKLNYEYKYDKYGNWIEKKVYNYDYDVPLVKTVTRKIVYE